MKTFKKDNVTIIRHKKGIVILCAEDLGFSHSIALTDEEIQILKEYFLKEVR